MISEVKIITRINQLKNEMGKLWDEKGETDHEILGLAMKIDKLLNQYNWLKLD
jgi:hypothetical protein